MPRFDTISNVDRKPPRTAQRTSVEHDRRPLVQRRHRRREFVCTTSDQRTGIRADRDCRSRVRYGQVAVRFRSRGTSRLSLRVADLLVEPGNGPKEVDRRKKVSRRASVRPQMGRTENERAEASRSVNQQPICVLLVGSIHVAYQIVPLPLVMEAIRVIRSISATSRTPGHISVRDVNAYKSWRAMIQSLCSVTFDYNLTVQYR